MNLFARTCAVDIGSMWVKASATVPGGTRQVSFPTRLAMGSRALVGREKPPQFVTFGDAHVRVGDRSSRTGFVESELPKALSQAHSFAILIAAAFDRLAISGASVLMVGSAVVSDDIEAAYLVNSLSRCKLTTGDAITVERLAAMGSVEAVLADISLDPFGRVKERVGREARGRFVVADLGAKAWRFALVSDALISDKVVFERGEIATEMAVEKRACAIVESRLNVSVSGVAEMMEMGVYHAKRAKRDVTMHIAQARKDVWASYGARLIELLDAHEALTVYAAGGNATVLKEASATLKDIDFKIAKHCEVSIVRGLLKSARRWGGQG